MDGVVKTNQNILKLLAELSEIQMANSVLSAALFTKKGVNIIQDKVSATKDTIIKRAKEFRSKHKKGC